MASWSQFPRHNYIFSSDHISPPSFSSSTRSLHLEYLNTSLDVILSLKSLPLSCTSPLALLYNLLRKSGLRKAGKWRWMGRSISLVCFFIIINSSTPRKFYMVHGLLPGTGRWGETVLVLRRSGRKKEVVG